MAMRSGSGTGVVVSLVVFVLCTVFLLVLTIVFYAGKSKAIQDADAARGDLARYVTREQRNRDEIKSIEAKVNPARGESVVGTLRQDYGQLMEYVSGDRGKPLDQVQAEFRKYGVAEDSTVRASIIKASRDLEQRRNELEQKNAQLTARENELAEKDKRMQQMQADHKEELERVTAKISEYQDAAEEYRDQLAKVMAEYQGNLDRNRQQFEGDITRLEGEKDSLFQERVILKSRLDELQEVLSANRLKAADPAKMVDAVIAEVSGRDEVFINRGARDRIVLGMTFEVYDSAAALGQFDPVTGAQPRGKASLQVTEVRSATSKCKITRAVPGRPVVRNDVAANAVYDPNYVFKFLVHGKFDVDGDGTPTEEEAEYIRSEILRWNGQVVTGDELPGDLDFLVLGVEPPRPFSPRAGASDLELEAWVQRRQAYEKYAELFRRASEAQIPVLNANRFFILTGYTER
jgi:hypothetical protein